MPPQETTQTASGNFLFDEEFLDKARNENTNDPEEDEPLSWRLDNSDSLSDWTIVIVRKSHDSNTITYHVHKNILAIGPRKSEYFARLFKIDKGVSESTTSTSTITLEDSAVDAFPLMLDYMYSLIDYLEDDSTAQATALRYLSRYFCIRKLYEHVTEFIQEDLRLVTATTYLLEADIYRDEKIAMAACSLCAQHLKDIARISSLTELSPRLFQSIVTADELKCDSAALSIIVVGHLEYYSDDVNTDLLNALTSSRFMPIVSSKVAESLLHFYLACQGNNQGETSLLDESLRERCTSSLAKSWKQVATNLKETKEKVDDEQTEINERTDAASSNLDWSKINTDILEASLCIAKDDVDSKDRKLKRKQNTIVSLNEEITELKAIVDEYRRAQRRRIVQAIVHDKRRYQATQDESSQDES
eukprot:scaffold90216_cov53-Attheya_sp.AAC.3